MGNNPSNAFLNVIRIGGSDRYATNKAVTEYFGPTAGVTTAIVASGADFPDALAAGPVVWKKGLPADPDDSCGALEHRKCPHQ